MADEINASELDELTQTLAKRKWEESRGGGQVVDPAPAMPQSTDEWKPASQVLSGDPDTDAGFVNASDIKELNAPRSIPVTDGQKKLQATVRQLATKHPGWAELSGKIDSNPAYETYKDSYTAAVDNKFRERDRERQRLTKLLTEIKKANFDYKGQSDTTGIEVIVDAQANEILRKNPKYDLPDELKPLETTWLRSQRERSIARGDVTNPEWYESSWDPLSLLPPKAQQTLAVVDKSAITAIPDLAAGLGKLVDNIAVGSGIAEEDNHLRRSITWYQQEVDRAAPPMDIERTKSSVVPYAKTIGNLMVTAPLLGAAGLGGATSARVSLGAMSASNAGDVADNVADEEMRRQMVNGEPLNILNARRKGAVIGLMVLPATYALERYSPEFRIFAEGKSLASTRAGAILSGAVGESLTEGGQGLVEEGVRYLPIVGTKELTRANIYQSLITNEDGSSVLERMKLGAFGGAVVGGVKGRESTASDRLLEIHKFIVNQQVLGDDMKRIVPMSRGDFELLARYNDVEFDHSAFSVVDAFVQARSKATGVNPNIVYGSMYQKFADAQVQTKLKTINEARSDPTKDYVKQTLSDGSDLAKVFEGNEGLASAKVMLDAAFDLVDDDAKTTLMPALKEWATTNKLKYKDEYELFAGGFLGYVRQGRASAANLVKPFETVGKFLKASYEGVQNAGINKKYNIDLERAFDSMFVAENPTQGEAYRKINDLKNVNAMNMKELKELKKDQVEEIPEALRSAFDYQHEWASKIKEQKEIIKKQTILKSEETLPNIDDIYTAIDHMTENQTKWFNSLNDWQKALLDKWFDGNAVSMPGEKNLNDVVKSTTFYQDLEALISSAPTVKGKFFRGIRVTPEQLDAYTKVGDTYTFTRYEDSTIIPEVAYEWNGYEFEGSNDHKIVFEIDGYAKLVHNPHVQQPNMEAQVEPLIGDYKIVGVENRKHREARTYGPSENEYDVRVVKLEWIPPKKDMTPEIVARQAEIAKVRTEVRRELSMLEQAKLQNLVDFAIDSRLTRQSREGEQITHAIDGYKQVPLSTFRKHTSGIEWLTRDAVRWAADMKINFNDPGSLEALRRIENVTVFRANNAEVFDYSLNTLASFLSRPMPKVPGIKFKGTVQAFLNTIDAETGTAYGTILKDDAWIDRREQLFGRELDNHDGIQYFKTLGKDIEAFLTAKATDNGVLRKLPSGDYQPQRLSDQGYKQRAFTEEGMDILQNGGPPLENWLQRLAQVNEIAIDADAKVSGLESESEADLSAIENDSNNTAYRRLAALVQRMRKDPTASKFGMLESSRIIKRVPDFTTDVNGTNIPMLHYDPIRMFHVQLFKGLTRIGMVREFGQGVLNNAASKSQVIEHGSKILDHLGLLEDRTTAAYLKQKVRQERPDLSQEEIVGMKKKDLVKLAKEMGIPMEYTKDEMLAVLKTVNMQSFKANQQTELSVLKQNNPAITKEELRLAASKLAKADEKLLKDIAQKIGGIDTKTTNADQILGDIRLRLETPIDDHLLKKVEELVGKSGNKNKLASLLLKIQGIPAGPGSGDLNPYVRQMKVVNDIVQPMLLTKSALPNLFQPIATLPAYTGIVKAWKNTAIAWFDTRTQTERLTRQGLLVETLNNTKVETRYGLRAIGHQIREFVFKNVGINHVADINNLATVLAGEDMVESFRRKGVSEMDVPMLKRLRLTDQQIKQLKSRQIDPDLKRVVIRNLIQETQYMKLDPQNRADVLNYPLGRLLLPLQTYTTQTLRQSGKHAYTFAKETKSYLKSPSKDGFKRWLGASRDVFNYFAFGVGSAMAGIMLNQWVRGAPPDYAELQDDDYWDEFAAGLFQASFAGPLGRMIDNMDYSNGNIYQYAFTMTPVVSNSLRSISLVFGAPFNEKFAQMPWYKRMYEAGFASTPLAKDLRRRTEYTMYPDAYTYDDVVARVRGYSRLKSDLAGETERSFGNQPVNPEYYAIFQALRCGDAELAKRETSAYYKRQMSKGIMPVEQMSKLRQSLLNRAPIKIDPTSVEYWQFIKSVPETERALVQQRDMQYRLLAKTLTGGVN